MLLNSLPSGGMMKRVACGRTTRHIATRCGMPKRLGRLHLTLVDRVDSRADDLAHVRTLVETEREDAGKGCAVHDEYPEVHGAWDQVEAKEQIRAEVDEEDLDDERRTAKDEHVEPREQAQRQEPRHAHEREDQSEDDPQELREH